MTVSFITPKQTKNIENILGGMIPTPNGQKHINDASGNVDLIKKGKVTLLIKQEWSDKPETVEFYVNNGVVYVEHKVINIVTEDVN
jgi:hypothetical protein